VLRDTESTSGIVLTNQTIPCPEFFERTVAQAQGEITCLPVSQPMIVRAAMLRELAKQFDRVVLHTHPHDPMPITAFSVRGGAPVAMFNHAHFSFCLGPSVADVIINTLDHFRKVTEKFRFPRKTAVLAGALGQAADETLPICKRSAKRRLGLSESDPLVMSIASEWYFKPIEGYDFFRTVSKLLDSHPSVNVLVVGVRPNSPLVPVGLRGRTRFHCVGPVLDPLPYYQAADVCLESFPMPSLGAFLEAVAYGEAFPVPVYGPSECILRVSQAPMFSPSFRPKDEDDYLAYIIRLLRAHSETREEARSLRLSFARFNQGTDQRLREVNRLIGGLQHAPQEIPQASFDDGADCRILGQLNSDNLPSSYLPYLMAVRVQAVAAARGLVPLQRAAFEAIRRPSAGLLRRLRKTAENA
jgi:hypothetical protein